MSSATCDVSHRWRGNRNAGRLDILPVVGKQRVRANGPFGALNIHAAREPATLGGSRLGVSSPAGRRVWSGGCSLGNQREPFAQGVTGRKRRRHELNTSGT